LVTNRYLEQNFGEGRGPTLEQCRFESTLPGEPFARVVRFNSLQVNGDHAVADISVTGGQADGSRNRLDLARQAGQWKLDYFANVELDRARFDAASKRDMVAQGTTQNEAACAVRRLRRFFDTGQIERAIVSGKTRIFGAAEVTCFGRKTLVHELTIGIRHAAPGDVPRQILDCVTRKIIGVTSTVELRVLFAAPDRFTDYFRGEAQTAARACAKESQAGLLPEPAPS